ncbi:hypothetical protein [Streptomyces sp. MZ04]|uniref:hypothetical protein n=1 Tax=Streptomyces sp. MZ04 TaxID=2559236 RepID=UPI00107E85B3|nr:hypothetical protein [Streptomyces sp. MZ04]TGA84536.1 hypothetical protein E2651_42465 [Streptomyces sp. MZ04]
MADIYEISMAIDLRDDISEAEIAELRWHLGLGPQPKRLTIVRAFPVVVEDDQGELVTEDDPQPLLGHQGAAWKVGGALASVLVRRDTGWALTARQEFHPDDCDRLGELLTWLAGKAGDHHQRHDGSGPAGVLVGWTRFYEEERPEPLMVRDGKVAWQ